MEDGTIAGQEVSLSARRAWIEIQAEREIKKLLDESLSARRAWIEIAAPACCEPAAHVALRKESVDRNTEPAKAAARVSTSLSARRAWIEIVADGSMPLLNGGRSPQGERG